MFCRAGLSYGVWLSCLPGGASDVGYGRDDWYGAGSGV